MKHLTVSLRVRIPLDEGTLDSAGWRSLWEEVDDLVEKFRGLGEVTEMVICGMPEQLVLVWGPDTEELLMRASCRRRREPDAAV